MVDDNSGGGENGLSVKIVHIDSSGVSRASNTKASSRYNCSSKSNTASSNTHKSRNFFYSPAAGLELAEEGSLMMQDSQNLDSTLDSESLMKLISLSTGKTPLSTSTVK